MSYFLFLCLKYFLLHLCVCVRVCVSMHVCVLCVLYVVSGMCVRERVVCVCVRECVCMVYMMCVHVYIHISIHLGAMGQMGECQRAAF